jgi:hypothetical protein
MSCRKDGVKLKGLFTARRLHLSSQLAERKCVYYLGYVMVQMCLSVDVCLQELLLQNR